MRPVESKPVTAAAPRPVEPRATPAAAPAPRASLSFPSPGDIFDTIKRGAEKVVDTIGGGVRNVADAARSFIDGLANQVKGLAEQIQRGLAPMGIQSSGLSQAQKDELAKVYGDDVDFSGVRVAQMPGWMEAAAAQADKLSGGRGEARTFTAGDVIFMPKAEYEAFQRGENNGLVVHEAAHVLQYRERGVDVAVESIREQMAHGGEAYDWKDDVAAGRGWSDLNVESQASIIDNAYGQGFFNQPGSKLLVSEDGQSYQVLPPGQQVPAGWKDVTHVLQDGIADLGNKPAPAPQPGPVYA